VITDDGHDFFNGTASKRPSSSLRMADFELGFHATKKVRDKQQGSFMILFHLPCY
jgi:hypothetical protein